MAFVKTCAQSIYCLSSKGQAIEWQFYDVNGHYFCTNWKGNTRDAKSYADLMRIRRILLSYPLDSKNPEGPKKFQVGRGPKATVKEAPASDSLPTDLTPEEQEIILETSLFPAA